MVKYLLFVLLMVGGSMSSNLDAYSLDLNSDHCEFYFPGGSSDDSDASDLLKTVESGGAVQVCTDVNGNKGYYVASPVSKENEVHYFYLRSVFRTPVADSYRWSHTPPKDLLQKAVREIYMKSAVNGGIRQNDSGFVQVQGISTSLFGVLDKAWKGILTSEEQFKEACSGYLLILSIFSSDIKALKRALYTDDPKDTPKMLSVNLIKMDDSSAPHYMFLAVNKSRGWQVNFDFKDDSINIKDISLISE